MSYFQNNPVGSLHFMVPPLDEMIELELDTWPNFGHQIFLGFGNEILFVFNLPVVIFLELGTYTFQETG